MSALALRFLGHFSNVQDQIESAARMLCFKRMQKGGGIIGDFVVSRINDEERVRLLMAIAEEMETDADLSNFKTVFMRVKKLRDAVAHASAFRTGNDPDRLEISRVALMVPTSRSKRATPDHVTRRQLTGAMHDCSWLYAQVTYVITSTPHAVLDIRMGSTPVTVFKPVARPEDWDGVVSGVPAPSAPSIHHAPPND